jgi:tetratricopeptide (TPR) repeat protein
VLIWFSCLAHGAQDAAVTKAAGDEKITQLYNQALRYEQGGDITKAISMYKEAIALGAKDVAVFLNLALIHKEASQYENAIAVLQEALRRNEGDQSKRADLAKVYNNLGNVYRAQGTDDKAMAAFQKALSLDSNLAGPNLNIGITYDVHQKMPDKAVSFYLREIQIAPDARGTYEAYLNLGIYYQEVTKEYDKAIEYSRHGIRVNPEGFDRYKAYNCLANSYYLKRDVKSAIENWSKVVEIAPNTQSGRNARNNIDALK